MAGRRRVRIAVEEAASVAGEAVEPELVEEPSPDSEGDLVGHFLHPQSPRRILSNIRRLVSVAELVERRFQRPGRVPAGVAGHDVPGETGDELDRGRRIVDEPLHLGRIDLAPQHPPGHREQRRIEQRRVGRAGGGPVEGGAVEAGGGGVGVADDGADGELGDAGAGGEAKERQK
jgi:hypothetical protein